MSKHVTPATRSAPEVRIVWPMNDHGAMTVRVESESEIRQIAEYESADVREALERLPAGATVPLEMQSVGMRGNAWRAVELVCDRSARDAASARPEYAAEQNYALDDEAREQKETARV